MIKRFAQEAAEKELSGGAAVVLDEFIPTNQGMLTGMPLFNLLKEKYLKEGKKHE